MIRYVCLLSTSQYASYLSLFNLSLLSSILIYGWEKLRHHAEDDYQERGPKVSASFKRGNYWLPQKRICHWHKYLARDSGLQGCGGQETMQRTIEVLQRRSKEFLSLCIGSLDPLCPYSSCINNNWAFDIHSHPETQWKSVFLTINCWWNQPRFLCILDWSSKFEDLNIVRCSQFGFQVGFLSNWNMWRFSFSAKELTVWESSALLPAVHRRPYHHLDRLYGSRKMSETRWKRNTTDKKRRILIGLQMSPHR